MAFQFNPAAFDRGAEIVGGYYKKERQDEIDRLNAEKHGWERTRFDNEQADRADNIASSDTVANTLTGVRGLTDSSTGRLLQSIWDTPAQQAQTPAEQNPSTNNAATAPNAVTNNVVAQATNTGGGRISPELQRFIEQDAAANGIAAPTMRFTGAGARGSYGLQRTPPQSQAQSRSRNTESLPQAQEQVTTQADPLPLGLRSAATPEQVGPQREATQQPLMVAQNDPRLDAYKELVRKSLRKGDTQTARLALEGYHSIRLESEMGAISSQVLQMTPAQINALASRMGDDVNTGLRGMLLESKFDPATGLATVSVGDKKINLSRTDMAQIASGLYAIERGATDAGYKAIAAVNKSIADLAAQQNDLTVKMANNTNDVAFKGETMRRQADVAEAQIDNYRSQSNKRNAPQVIQLQDRKTQDVVAFDINSIPIDSNGRLQIPEGYVPVRAKTDPQIKAQIVSKFVADGMDLNAAMFAADRVLGDAPDVSTALERAKQLNQERGAKKAPLTEEQIVAAAAAKGYTPYQRTSGGLFGRPELLFENPHGDRKSASELGIK